MPAGFQAINDSNIVQIDALYKNYYLKEHGTVAVTWGNVDADPPPGAVKTTVVVSNARNPVMAVCVDRHIRVWRTQLNATTFQFDYVADDDQSGLLPRPFNMEYYIYDSPQPAPSAHGVGMQVYTASNELAFDSNFNFMKITGFIEINATFPPIGYGNQRTFRFSNDKTAVLTCQQAVKVLLTFENVGPGGEPVEFMEFYSLTPKVNNQGTITTLDRLVESRRTPVLTNVTRPQAFILALDVSNIT